VFLTGGMPGGIHVRIVAPLARRVENVAEREGVTLKVAASKVALIEKSRDTFYKRHWPDRLLTPEEFTVTFNSGRLSIAEMVQAVLPMVQGVRAHV
jgi:cytidylate kinase